MKNYTMGMMDKFAIESDAELKMLDIKSCKYSIEDKLYNQFGQEVVIYIPDNECNQVIVSVNDKFAYSGFYDCGDLTPDSDYLPVLYNGKIYCYFSYYYASKDYYYPAK